MSTNSEPEFDFANPVVRERFFRAYRTIALETLRRKEEQGKVASPEGVIQEAKPERRKAKRQSRRLNYEQLSLFS